MKKYNLLLTAIGAAGSQTFIKSLDRKKFNIVGCDASKYNSYVDKVDKFYKIPKANEKSYIAKIIQICKDENIDLIVPVMEPEIYKLIKNKDIFEKEKIKILASNENVLNTTQNKINIINFFKSKKIKSPELHSFNHYSLPVILKPIKGTGSKGIYIAKTKTELEYYVNIIDKEKYIIQEFIEGKEISIDCFLDKDSKPVAIIPRYRLEIRNGLCFKSQTFHNKKLIKKVKKILKKINIIGPCNIQAIRSKKDNNFYFFEINSRIGGTYIHSVRSGLDLNQYIIDFCENKNSKRLKEYNEKFMIRYWKEKYFSKG